MADVVQGLRLCTYNCRSMKNSIHDIRELRRSHDLVLLQEHWLLPFELNLLNCVCDDFMATGVSAVNVTDDKCKTSSSAVAEKPRCRVGQFGPNITGTRYCAPNVVGLGQEAQVTAENAHI